MKPNKSHARKFYGAFVASGSALAAGAGRAFTAAAGVLVFAAALSGCVVQKGPVPQAEAIAAPAPAATLPLTTFGGRPVVEVSINGTPARTFILDTGASYTVLDVSLAEELDLPVTGTQMVKSPLGPNEIESEIVSVSKLAVAGLTFENQEATAFDLLGFMQMEGAPVGVLSYRIFDGYRLVFDYPGEELRLYKGSLPAPDGRSVFGFETTVPEVSVRVAGRDFPIHLDTGSPGGFTFPLAAAADLPLASPPTVTGRAKTVNAEFEILGSTLDGTIELGDMRFENPRVSFIEGAPFGNIGNEILSRLVVTVDPANGRVQFAQPNGAVGTHAAGVQATEAPSVRRVVMPGGGKKRYGIQFASIDGSPIPVMGVEAGSPAEAAGLGAGDLITAINGTPVESMSRDDRIAALRASPLGVSVNRAGNAIEVEMSLD
ncbi:MAG: PDZ domain-containing protein [Gemmatimonadetes bacterium]|nr:PDZ domain-containing protein [Gemmatimonadota bacterium]